MDISRRKNYVELVAARHIYKLPAYIEEHPWGGYTGDWSKSLWIRYVHNKKEKPHRIKDRAGNFLFSMRSGGELIVAIYADDPLKIVLYSEGPLPLMREIAKDYEKKYGWPVSIEIRDLVEIQL